MSPELLVTVVTILYLTVMCPYAQVELRIEDRQEMTLWESWTRRGGR